MSYDKIAALRAMIMHVERNGPAAATLFAHEAEYLAAPEGISVIIPVHNGAEEMEELLLSLRNQTLDRQKFEAIFALNGCTDASRAVIDRFSATSGVNTIILEDPVASVARARNAALQSAKFRLATFVDHDDHISRAYLEEAMALGDCRSVVVSNIIKIENDKLVEDYAQTVISREFKISRVHGPEDISLCCRAYTLNAIKTAPTFMMRRVLFDETMSHSEDVKYWRDLFHAFTPITVKSPTQRDMYYRKVIDNSLSRRNNTFYAKAKPRFALLDLIEAQAGDFACTTPQRHFDAQLKGVLLATLFYLGQ